MHPRSGHWVSGVLALVDDIFFRKKLRSWSISFLGIGPIICIYQLNINLNQNPLDTKVITTKSRGTWKWHLFWEWRTRNSVNHPTLEGYFSQNYGYACRTLKMGLSLYRYINFLYKIPSMHHFRKKVPNLLFTKIWALSSLMKTHQSLYQNFQNSTPKGRHIYGGGGGGRTSHHHQPPPR